MADTPDLGSGAARLGGSSPPSRIPIQNWIFLTLIATYLIGCSSVGTREDPKLPPKNLEKFLQSQNERTEDYFRPLKGSVSRIFKEALEAKPKIPEAPPLEVNGYRYWLSQDLGERFPRLIRSMAQGPQETALNQNVLALEHPNTILNLLRISPDNRCLVYGLQPINSAVVSIWRRDLQSQNEEVIEPLNGVDAQWGLSCDELYIVKRDAAGTEHLIRRVIPQGIETELFHTHDPTQSLLLKKSESGQFLFVNNFTSGTDDIYAIDLHTPSATLQQLQKKEGGVQYNVSHFANGFLITTERKLLFRSLDGKHVRLIRSPSEKIYESAHAFSKHAVIISRSPPIPELLVISASDFSIRVIQPLASMGTITLSPQANFNNERFNFSVETLSTPPIILSSLDVLPKISGPELAYATSFDGTKIPMSILGQGNDSQAFLLHGYGAYGVSAEETYAPEIQSLRARGIGYAICHGRGGGEMGTSWHLQGSGAFRHKAEEDFRACAHYLVDNGYAQKDKLFASGRSAGALLLLSAAQTEPGLFAGAILESPLIDTKNLASAIDNKDFAEWGTMNPILPIQLNSLYLFTGLHDPLTPIQPIADWFAGSQQTAKGKLLLQTSDTALHTGEPDFHDAMWERARQIAFLVNEAQKP